MTTQAPKQVHQYPHESWSEAWHRRSAENLAKIETAIANIDKLHKRDREIGQEMVLAFTDLSRSFKTLGETL